MRGAGCKVGMPFTSWPKVDRERWTSAASPDEFALEVQPLGEWSRRHQDLARYNYGIWLAFLAEHHPTSLDDDPAERATPERVRHFVQNALTRLQPRTVAVALVNMKGVLKSLAPEWDCAWMERIIRRLKSQAAATPPAPKAFCHAGVLLEIGQRLMIGACDGSEDVIDPVAIRDGLIIALLAAVPVRIHAFSRIRVGRHLCQTGDGVWTLGWEATETKGQREDHWCIPAYLVPMLETYLAKARPALLAKSANSPVTIDHLWIGTSGQPIGHQVLRQIIKRRTAEALGHPVCPHAFRTSAATTFVLDNPEHAIEAAALLAHTDFTVTEKHYLAGRRQFALRIAHRALRQIRRTSYGVD